MATTPILPATGYFATVADVRATLGLRDEDNDRDALIQALINRSTYLFGIYTGRNLKSRTYTDVLLDGTGEESMLLPEFPVTDIASIKYEADRAFSTASALVQFDGTGTQASYDYVLDEDTGMITLVGEQVWPEGTKTVKVTYTAGLDIADAQELVQAQCAQVAAFWFAIGRDPKLVGVSMGSISQQLVSGDGPDSVRSAQLTPDVRMILDAHRRPGFSLC